MTKKEKSRHHTRSCCIIICCTGLRACAIISVIRSSSLLLLGLSGESTDSSKLKRSVRFVIHLFSSFTFFSSVIRKKLLYDVYDSILCSSTMLFAVFCLIWWSWIETVFHLQTPLRNPWQSKKKNYSWLFDAVKCINSIRNLKWLNENSFTFSVK